MFQNISRFHQSDSKPHANTQPRPFQGRSAKHNGFSRRVLKTSLLAALLFTAVSVDRTSAETSSADAPTAVSATSVQAPLYFEPNKGQTDPSVRYLSRGNGYRLFLTPSQTVLALQKPSGKRQKSAPGPQSPAAAEAATPAQTTFLRMKLKNASPAPLKGSQLLPGKSNYLMGNDRRKWQTSIPHYEQVWQEGVYPGIDVVYYGKQQQLEYDFIVAPGVDSKQIRLQFEGAKKISLNAKGDLVLNTPGGDLIQHKPEVYQMAEGKRKPVQAAYLLSKTEGNRTEVGFKIAAYDRRKPLVIDPVLTYSTFLGGSGNEQGLTVAADSLGNAYVFGYTASTNMIISSLTYKNTNGGANDIFVSKFSSNGSALLYSTYIGGSSTDQANSMEVDLLGNVFLTGETASSNFPTTLLAFREDKVGGDDAFVLKLAATGGSLLYSTFLGGTGDDIGTGIEIDTLGNAYIAGYTNSTNYTVTTGAYKTVRPGGTYDSFVTKVNPLGTGLVYSTYLGGSNVDTAFDLAIDGAGNAYVTGQTGSSNCPTTANALRVTFGGGQDGFVSKLNATGTALVYSTFLGGSGYDYGNAIDVDSAGNAYVTGFSGSTNFPTTAGAFRATKSGTAFVTKINPTGTGTVYSTFLGGSNEASNGIAVNSAGCVYVTGYTDSAAYPVTADAIQSEKGGLYDGFFTKLNATGSAQLYSTYLGGAGTDVGKSVVVDAADNAYLTGYSDSTAFPVTNGAYRTSLTGGTDAFLMKFNMAAASPPPSVPSAPGGFVGTVPFVLTWTDAANETGYKIERSLDGGGFTQIAAVGANITSYSVPGLLTKKTYSFRVRAYNNSGNSSYTPVISFYTGG